MLWVVEQRNLWGDLGAILQSGMARREASSGPLKLERTGPFLPPLSTPWFGPEGSRVVVSDVLRCHLEGAGFAGLRFCAVAYSRVVRLNWHAWDLSAEEPAEYPKWGEPGSYIEDQAHDLVATAAMPAAWELLGPIFPLLLERLESPDGGYLDQFQTKGATVAHPHLFLSRPTYGELVVDETGRELLTRHAGEWVRFCNVELSVEPGDACDSPVL